MTTDTYTERAFRAYVDCAIWSSSNEAGESLEYLNYGPDDVAASALDSMRADLADFIEGADGLLDGLEAEQVGHDFWLTRNRHGAGFWDRGLGEVGDQLTAKAHPYGESDLHVADDGLLYVS